MLNSVCTNELKMAKAVVNEFINKVGSQPAFIMEYGSLSLSE